MTIPAPHTPVRAPRSDDAAARTHGGATEEPPAAPNVDELAHVAARVTHERVHDLPADMLDDTFRSVRSNLAIIFASWGERSDPTTVRIPPDAHVYARTYARRGLGLDVLLQAYRAAQGSVTRQWLIHLQATMSDTAMLADEFGAFSDWLFAWVQSAEVELATAYEAERAALRHDRVVRLAREVRAILDGRVDVVRASGRLGYELRREHVAFVVWSEHDSAGERLADMELLARRAAELLGAKQHLAVLLDGVLACWAGVRPSDGPPPADALDALRRRPGGEQEQGLCVALGEASRGVEGFRRSHEQALLARRTVQRLSRGATPVVRYDDVALDALLCRDGPEATHFRERELGVLAEETDQALRLRSTLLVFFEEGGSFLRASRRLGVHENTVAYRVRRAEQLLGRCVTERRPELWMALRLARFDLR